MTINSLRIRDLNSSHDELISKHLKYDSLQALIETRPPYIVVDRYNNLLSLPESELNLTAACRFVEGPTVISSSDDLYEILDSHWGSTHKYFIVYNSIDETKGRDKKFSAWVKLYRKFWNENGASIESVATFIEIDKRGLAAKLGI